MEQTLDTKLIECMEDFSKKDSATRTEIIHTIAISLDLPAKYARQYVKGLCEGNPYGIGLPPKNNIAERLNQTAMYLHYLGFSENDPLIKHLSKTYQGFIFPIKTQEDSETLKKTQTQRPDKKEDFYSRIERALSKKGFL